MKTLLLVRHAKSSWDDATLPDRDRPLEARGEHDAAKMSRRLSKRRVQPDLIMSSPAVRALETAKAIAAGLDYPIERIVVNERLYATTAEDLIALIEGLDDTLDCAILVGHNPEFTDLALRLGSEASHLPTCGIAEFGFDAKAWKGLGHTKPLTVAFASPKHPAS